MIIKSDKQLPTFTPINITVTIENIDEARLWYSIFDNEAIKSAIGYGNSVDLRCSLTEFYSYDVEKEIEEYLIKAFYDRYKEGLLELIDTDKVG